jgi:hypothetical protein
LGGQLDSKVYGKQILFDKYCPSCSRLEQEKKPECPLVFKIKYFASASRQKASIEKIYFLLFI